MLALLGALGLLSASATHPIRGYNNHLSWIGDNVNGSSARAWADIMATKLLPSGYNHIILEGTTCCPRAKDGYGRLWPVKAKFEGDFKRFVSDIHAKGMKLGVWLIRGIPKWAYDQDLPIYGSNATASEIANTSSTCGWSVANYGIDMSKPGAQEYYDSVASMWCSYDVDLVKLDDFSAPFHLPEIIAMHKAFQRCTRPPTIMLSPGDNMTLANIEAARPYASIFRSESDVWPYWHTGPQGASGTELGIKKHWKTAATYANLNRPNSWPFLGLLPFGRVRDVMNGVFSPTSFRTNLTADEAQSAAALWMISRSPLIFSGDLLSLDDTTLNFLTNEEALRCQESARSAQVVDDGEGGLGWLASPSAADPASRDGAAAWIALFNLGESERVVSMPYDATGLAAPAAQATEVWSGAEGPLARRNGTFQATLRPHASVFWRLDARQ